MEENTREAPSPWSRRDWQLIGLLMVVACLLRLWQLTHTEVAARDSIGFIRYAWEFRNAPVTEWPGVMKELRHHPLYPLWVLAVSRAVEPFYHTSLAAQMQLSAQLASAICSVLLVLPLYALGRRLFDRRVGFLAALLLQCLPMSGRLFGDGLSEATFLLLAASALAWGVNALESPDRWGPFAWTGIFSALAYLTRPEGAVVAAVTGMLLVVGQAIPLWRRNSASLIRCGVSLAVPMLVAAGIFVALTGKLSVKPTANEVLKNDLHQTSGRSVAGPLFAVWDVDEDQAPSLRGMWGLKALVMQIGKGSLYVGWLFVVVGIWHGRGQLLRRPGFWLPVVVAIGLAYALWRVVVVVGYLSDRHTLLIMACGLPFGAAGLILFGEELARRWPRLRLAPMLVPLVFVAACLPKTLEPLHHYRAGFRAAGLWLAEHAHPTDAITDPLCWSHYWSGRVFLEHTEWEIPAGHRRVEYVVIEKTDNRHPRLPTYQAALEKVRGEPVIYRWKGKRGKKEAEVVIYAIPLKDGL